jgi:hypothetical protein
VATAFVKVYRRWAVTDISQPRAYIRRAVANEIVSGFRRRGRERAFIGRGWAAGPSLDAGDGVCERDAVEELLAGLPPRQRMAVTLRFLEDLSEAEVARRMGTSVGAVKSNTARGLVALRAAIAKLISTGTSSPRAIAQDGRLLSRPVSARPVRRVNPDATITQTRVCAARTYSRAVMTKTTQTEKSDASRMMNEAYS